MGCFSNGSRNRVSNSKLNVKAKLKESYNFKLYISLEIVRSIENI